MQLLEVKKKRKHSPVLILSEEEEEKKKFKRKSSEKSEKHILKELKLNFVQEIKPKIAIKRFQKMSLEPSKTYKELAIPFLKPETLKVGLKLQKIKAYSLTETKKFKELKLEFKQIFPSISLKKISSIELKPRKKYKEIDLSFVEKENLLKISLLKVEQRYNISSPSIGGFSLGGGGGSMEDKEYPEFVNFGAGFSRGTGSPKVIITNLPMIYSYLATEIYRELVGEYPKVEMKVVSEKGGNIDEIALDRQNKDEDLFAKLHSVELGGKVEIFLIKRENREKELKLFGNLLKILKQRIEKSSFEKLGFLIIGIYSDPAEIKEDVEKIVEEIEGNKEKAKHTYLIKFESCLTDKPEIEDLRFLATIRKRMSMLNLLKSKYNFFIKRNKVEQDELGDVEQYPFKVAVVKCYLDKIKRSENESEEDFLIRVFEKGLIKTESGIENNKVIPDIEINYNEIKEKEFVEIETLISTFEPLKKLDETVEKYFFDKDTKEDKLGEKTLTVVVKPETAILYLSQLKKRERLYRKFYKKEKISIKVICFEKKQPTLYSLEEFEKLLKESYHQRISPAKIVSGVF